jgi:hypothetical protein
MAGDIGFLRRHFLLLFIGMVFRLRNPAAIAARLTYSHSPAFIPSQDVGMVPCNAPNQDHSGPQGHTMICQRICRLSALLICNILLLLWSIGAPANGQNPKALPLPAAPIFCWGLIGYWKLIEDRRHMGQKVLLVLVVQCISSDLNVCPGGCWCLRECRHLGRQRLIPLGLTHRGSFRNPMHRHSCPDGG